MDNNFPVPFNRNRSIQVRGDISRHLESREVEAVTREGVRQLIGIELEYEKTSAVQRHVQDLASARQKLGDSFFRQAYAALEANHRSPQHQAAYQAFHDDLVGDYLTASHSVFGAGIMAMGDIVVQSVMKDPPKRWWER